MTPTHIYVLSAILLLGSPLKQALILIASKRPDTQLDTKLAFQFHGLASLGAVAFHLLRLEMPCALCFLVIGVVSFWTYWIRPLYKKD